MSSSSQRADERSAPLPLASLPRPEPRLAAAPIPLTPLVGRERERAELLAIFDEPAARLVVLTGPGGIGKTRVALDLADALADRFDGVGFVALAAITDPDLVVPTIARGIGAGERPGQPGEDVLIGSIRDRSLCLVIDNLEQVAVAAPVLSRLLAACPRLRFLVTSREKLGLTGERDYPITPLPLPRAETASTAIAANPAVTLFVRAVRANRPEFKLDAGTIAPVVAICQQLEGWPLALELAAARTGVLSIPALLARLDQRFSVLANGPVDREPRFRSMRDAIAWSVHLLQVDERTALGRLSVFRGGFDLAAAEAVLATTGRGHDALTLVESLINKSLLRLESATEAESRYTMLETIREYAAELLASDSEVAAIHERHTAWFIALARSGRSQFKGEQTPLWIARFNAERENLREVLRRLEENGQRPLFMEMAWSLAVYWDYQGELVEGRRWLERALAIRTGAGEPDDHLPFAEAWLGWLLFRQGELDEAQRWLDAALQHWQTLGNVNSAAYIHSTLGQVCQERGDLAGARRSFELAMRIFRECGDEPGIVEALANLSELDYQVGNQRQALEYARSALDLAQALGTQTYIAVCQVAMAEALTMAGDVDGALALAMRALVGARALGFTVCTADAISTIAAVEATRGDLEAAAKHLGMAWRWLSRTGSASFFFQHQYLRTLEVTRQGLGLTRFERAWNSGLATPDTALDELASQEAAPLASTETTARRTLTTREREVLTLLAAGMSDREIAEQLFITYRTANSYVARVLEKLNVPSRTAAATMAIREGLI